MFRTTIRASREHGRDPDPSAAVLNPARLSGASD